MTLFLTILFILVCLLLIGIILLQKGRGGGLSGAFGGAGGHSAFGSRTGDMFTWVTVMLVGLFLLLGVVASKYFRPPPEPTAQAAEPNAPADTEAGTGGEDLDAQGIAPDEPNLTATPPAAPPVETFEPTAPTAPPMPAPPSAEPVEPNAPAAPTPAAPETDAPAAPSTLPVGP